jgi:glyoxylase-like metal-dependent hydrolase (beta-lactamase superfamily II)
MTVRTGKRSEFDIDQGRVLRRVFTVLLLILSSDLPSGVCFAQSQNGEPLRPEWCRQLPRAQYAKLERVHVANDWFEVYRIRPGVFAIYEPHQFEEVISYLILGDRRALLFDTGMGISKISEVVSELTKLPIAVVNSHTHFDHVGGNAEFSDIYDEDTPYTRANEHGRSNVYSRDAVAPQRICGHLPTSVHLTSYSVRPWRVTHRVKDGEEFDLGERRLKLIFTPGHTPDSLCLLDLTNGLLFTGDTFYPGPIYLFAPETDFAAYSKSVDSLAKLAPKLTLLLPSHNVPIAEPRYLTELAEAVKKIQTARAVPRLNHGRREYSFSGFSVLLSAK